MQPHLDRAQQFVHVSEYYSSAPVLDVDTDIQPVRNDSMFAEMAADLMVRQHAQPDGGAAATPRAAWAVLAHRAHRRFLDVVEAGGAAEAQGLWKDHLVAIGEHYQQRWATPLEMT